MTARLLSLLATACLLFAGCSLPADEAATVIDSERLPDVLRSDVTVTTTTIQAPRTTTLDIYLINIDETSDRKIVQPVSREVDQAATFDEQLSFLFGDEVRSEAEQEAGFSNAVREFTLLSATVNDNDVAIIDIVATDIDGNVLTPDNDILRDAAAQIVYTATGFTDIAAVRLLIDSERIVLPTTDEDGDTGDVITRDDYQRYDPDFVPATTSTQPANE